MHRLGVKHSYTLEASFGGSTLGDRVGTHLGRSDLENMGKHICDTILDFYDPDPSKVLYCQNEILNKLKAAMTAKYGEHAIPDDPNLLHELESDTSGSNSSSDDGLPAHLREENQVCSSLSNGTCTTHQPHIFWQIFTFLVKFRVKIFPINHFINLFSSSARKDAPDGSDSASWTQKANILMSKRTLESNLRKIW